MSTKDFNKEDRIFLNAQIIYFSLLFISPYENFSSDQDTSRPHPPPCFEFFLGFCVSLISTHR